MRCLEQRDWPVGEFIRLLKATTLGICGKSTLLYHGIYRSEYLNKYVDGTDSAAFITEEDRMFLYTGPDKRKYIFLRLYFLT